MKADATAAGQRRVPRRPDIHLYVQDLEIDSSLIRSHYELPIDTATSSRKKKSRKGITIRKNRQPVSIGQSSNSRVKIKPLLGKSKRILFEK